MLCIYFSPLVLILHGSHLCYREIHEGCKHNLKQINSLMMLIDDWPLWESYFCLPKNKRRFDNFQSLLRLITMLSFNIPELMRMKSRNIKQHCSNRFFMKLTVWGTVSALCLNKQDVHVFRVNCINQHLAIWEHTPFNIIRLRINRFWPSFVSQLNQQGLLCLIIWSSAANLSASLSWTLALVETFDHVQLQCFETSRLWLRR